MKEETATRMSPYLWYTDRANVSGGAAAAIRGSPVGCAGAVDVTLTPARRML